MTIRFTQGNILEENAEALVNTVNTVGVMGKGVALMFKEAFPENFQRYQAACALDQLRVGKMFVTERHDLYGPKWIVNFPTKAHWRFPSQLGWIDDGLEDLKRVILERGIRSVALPPLGAGNGGLAWDDVRELILDKLSDLENVDVIVYEPTKQYQNVAKRTGVEKLTPPRALIAELVRRYSIVGIQCSLLEVQKLGYFVERFSVRSRLNSLSFEFSANKYGPYSDRLKHLINSLDGSYLHCEKRLADAGPFEPISFDYKKKDILALYLKTEEAKPFQGALEGTSKLIDGFESPLGMELLATVDWLISRYDVEPTVAAIRERLPAWPGGRAAAERKVRLFEDRIVGLALEALSESKMLA